MNAATLILLVEDDCMIRALHQRVLEHCVVGVPVETAADGLEALAALHRRGNAPTLVLLDLNMPNMDGLAFLETYLALPFAERSQTQIIVLSATMMHEEKQRVQALGVQFEPKPLCPALVQEIKGRCTAARRQAPASK